MEEEKETKIDGRAISQKVPGKLSKKELKKTLDLLWKSTPEIPSQSLMPYTLLLVYERERREREKQTWIILLGFFLICLISMGTTLWFVSQSKIENQKILVKINQNLKELKTSKDTQNDVKKYRKIETAQFNNLLGNLNSISIELKEIKTKIPVSKTFEILGLIKKDLGEMNKKMTPLKKAEEGEERNESETERILAEILERIPKQSVDWEKELDSITEILLDIEEKTSIGNKKRSKRLNY